MRPGIVPLNRQTLSLPALNRKQHAMIVLCSVIRYILDIAVVLALILIGQIQRSPLVEIGESRRRSEVYGWIVLSVTQQVNSAVAEVIGRYQPVAPKLSLNAEIPLVNIRRVVIRPIAVVRTGLRKNRILVGKLRKRIRQANAGVWIVKTRGNNLNLIAERCIGSLRAVRPKMGVIVKNPSRSSNRHPAIAAWIQRESQARGEMPPSIVMILVRS